MVCRRFFIPIAAIVALAAGLVFSTATAAFAQGTAHIQQADGTVNVYDDVKIQIVQKTLTMTSADGKGTLIIYRAACSYQGDIMVCLPTGATLVQGGSVSPINIARGTVYLNRTDDTHTLSASTMKIAPHSIMMALTTRKGTYITLSGGIDKEQK